MQPEVWEQRDQSLPRDQDQPTGRGRERWPWAQWSSARCPGCCRVPVSHPGSWLLCQGWQAHGSPSAITGRSSLTVWSSLILTRARQRYEGFYPPGRRLSPRGVGVMGTCPVRTRRRGHPEDKQPPGPKDLGAQSGAGDENRLVLSAWEAMARSPRFRSVSGAASDAPWPTGRSPRIRNILPSLTAAASTSATPLGMVVIANSPRPPHQNDYPTCCG